VNPHVMYIWCNIHLFIYDPGNPDPVPCTHFVYRIWEPASSYSALVIHLSWKLDRDARMDPPVQAECFLFTGASTLTFVAEGASSVTSLVIRSAMPAQHTTPTLTLSSAA
jgi:hypothetical protein